MRTQKWRMRIKLKAISSTENSSAEEMDSDTHNGTPTFRNRMSKNRALRRAKASMPETPSKRAELIREIASSPRCSKHLQTSFLTPEMKENAKLGEQFIESFSAMTKEASNSKDDKTGAMKAKRTLKTMLAKTLENTEMKRKVEKKVGLWTKKKKRAHGHPWWMTPMRKVRKDCIMGKNRKDVTDFFLSGEVTREVPNKKDVSKKSNESKLIMTMPIKEAYLAFKKKHPERKIGFTTFYKLKPKNIKKVSETNRRCCLCQTCCNVALMVEAANKFEKDKSEGRSDLTKKEASDLTVCNYTGDFPKAKCITRKCNECSASNIKKYFQDLAAQHGDSNIEYYRWESISLTTKDDTVKKCISCVQKSCTFNQFLDEFENCISPLPNHLFRAKWQIQNLETCKKVLKQNEAILVMDFAENYSCRYQNEIQSAFWETTQVTIHPMMLYYHSKDEDNQDILKKHSLIGISNDPKHDAHAVQMYRMVAQNILKEENSGLEKIYEWTDGCAAQYKGKTSFADISFDNIKVQRNFFETSHGKNVCDGLGAVVKNSCHQAVISGKEIINSARSFHNYCERKLNMQTVNSKREFVYIDTDVIERERPDKTNVKTLVGTRKVHSIRNVGEPYLVQHKNLSCFCEGCLSDVECMNMEYVDPWDEVSLANKPVTSKKKEPVATKKKEPVATKKTEPVVTKKTKPVVTKKTKTTRQKAEATASNDSAPPGQSETVSVNGSEISKDQFVRVRIHGKRTSKVFVAQVIDTDMDEIQVSFMERTTGNLYRWPSTPETSWESRESVVESISNPVLSKDSTNDRQLFIFE